MYTPTTFEITDQNVIHDIVARNSLATIVAVTAEGLEANHIPLWFDGDSKLRGHIAKANPLWQNVANGTQVLALFQGPHSYISPGWLPSKQATGKVVPTWDYIAVHVSGSIHFTHDDNAKRELLIELTQQHERDEPNPWQIDDAPAAFSEKLLKAIVGFEIRVDAIVGKAKLSQNKSAADREAIAQHLVAKDSPLAVMLETQG